MPAVVSLVGTVTGFSRVEASLSSFALPRAFFTCLEHLRCASCCASCFVHGTVLSLPVDVPETCFPVIGL